MPRFRVFNWSLLFILLFSLAVISQEATESEDEFFPLEEPTETSGNASCAGCTGCSVAGDGEFQNLETATTGPDSNGFNDLYYLVIGLVLATMVAGILVRYERLRFLRMFFLLGSLVYLGFMRGGCPCMIQGFQNLILVGFGQPAAWPIILLFLILLPLTYFFGRVWCGWICHLGALQEFLHWKRAPKWIRSERVQRGLRIMQYLVFVTLIAQIVITRSNIFIHYDPFKVAFNLFSTSTLGYVLLAILLVSSVLIYRPFCRGVCPVGFVLAWVHKLPGANRLQLSRECISCGKCARVCPTGAITIAGKKLSIQEADCIRCGDCLSSCRKNALQFSATGKNCHEE